MEKDIFDTFFWTITIEAVNLGTVVSFAVLYVDSVSDQNNISSRAGCDSTKIPHADRYIDIGKNTCCII